jgi:hypothetical protein
MIPSLIPADVLSAETAYVLASRWWGQRLWRSARAAWRCARIAGSRP